MYADFYELRHVLILGRVTTGEGGTVILDTENEVVFFNEKAKRIFPLLWVGEPLAEQKEIVEILRRESGAPYVTLYGAARKKAEEMGITDWKISITNTKEVATAFVIAVADDVKE